MSFYSQVEADAGKEEFTRETVIVARYKQIQVWETTTDSEVILIVVGSQPPSTGILGMSQREQ